MASRTLKWTILAVVVGVFSICGFVGCFVYKSVMGTWDIGSDTLNKEEQAAKSEGLPLEIKDIIPPLPDPSENAAVVYRHVSQVWDRKKEPKELSSALSALSHRNALPQEIETIRLELKRLEPGLSLLQKASRLPHCVFDRDWNLGAAVLFPEFAKGRRAAKLLDAKAVVAAREGRFDEAEMALRSTFAMANHIGSEPTLIAMLVDVALNALALATIQLILEENDSNPKALSMAERLLKSYPSKPSFRHALYGELVIGRIIVRTIKDLHTLELLSSGNEMRSGGPRLPNTITDSVRYAWQVRLLQFWRRSFRRINVKPDDAARAGKILDEESQKEERHNDVSHLMNRILMPLFGQAGNSIVRLEARAQVTKAFAAVLSFRKSHGKLPQNLSDVGIFVDPFDKKPLRYARTGSGFKLYSIGTDLVDDGGVFRLPDKPMSNHEDIGIEFPPPVIPRK